MNGNSDSSNGHSWDVPSSTGLDRDDCVILGYLPIDYDAATNGILKEGSPVVLPTELLDGMAKRWPKDYMTLLSALMHQAPENAWLGDKGKSLFLRWHIVSDERGVREFTQPNGGKAWAIGEGAPLCEDWIGVRIHAWKGHPGELAVHDFFGDASGDDPKSNWIPQLTAHDERRITPFVRHEDDGGSYSFPPLGGKAV